MRYMGRGLDKAGYDPRILSTKCIEGCGGHNREIGVSILSPNFSVLREALSSPIQPSHLLQISHRAPVQLVGIGVA